MGYRSIFIRQIESSREPVVACPRCDVEEIEDTRHIVRMCQKHKSLSGSRKGSCDIRRVTLLLSRVSQAMGMVICNLRQCSREELKTC